MLSHREHWDPARPFFPHWDPALGHTWVKALWDVAHFQGMPRQDHLTVALREKLLSADQSQAVGEPVELMAQGREEGGS